MRRRTREVPQPSSNTSRDRLCWRIERSDGYRSLTWCARLTANNDVLIESDELHGWIKLTLLQGSWFVDLAGAFTRPRLPAEPSESITDYWMRATYTSGGWCSAATIVFYHDAITRPPAQRWQPFTVPRILHWERIGAQASSVEVQLLVGKAGLPQPEQSGEFVDAIQLCSGSQLAAVIRGNLSGSGDRNPAGAALSAIETRPPTRMLAFGWEAPIDSCLRIADRGVLTNSS